MGDRSVIDVEPRRRGWTARLGLGLAVLLLAVAAGVVALRLLGIETGPLAYIVALTPWFLLVTAAGLVLAALARSRLAVLVALALVVVQTWWLLPIYVQDTDTSSGPTAVVASVNLGVGQGSAADVVALVRDAGVSVLSVQELTPGALTALEEAGLDDLLPHRFVRAEKGIKGTGLWSDRALEDATDVPGFVSHLLTARTVDGVTLVAAHPVAPGVRDGTSWAAEQAALLDVLERLDGDVILAGDLNATRDQVSVRRYEQAGYVDSADQAGDGFVATFPQGRAPWPLAAIDHVMLRSDRLSAIDLVAVPVGGSDHRAIASGLVETDG